MTELLIDNKKYFVVPEKEYFNLQKKAVKKTVPEKFFSIDEARAYSKKLIHQWSKIK
jgi:hypothetical protein